MWRYSIQSWRLFDLTILVVENSGLIEIKTETFHGMENLEELNLQGNKLKSVPSDSFNTLTKLRTIDLSFNKIKQLSSDVFSKNLNLERIDLSFNEIKFLGTELFSELTKLNFVDLLSNRCMNKEYNGFTEIYRLKEDIKINCYKSHGWHLSIEEELDCKFRNLNSHNGLIYLCNVEYDDENRLIVNRFTGTHIENKTDSDVKGISIISSKTEYFPTNIGSLFNLTYFHMYGAGLIEIKSKDFVGMQDLEVLFLTFNKITHLPSDVFSTLTKLNFINLSHNQIEELPTGLFSNNLKLEIIDLMSNEIKYIGTGLFNGLPNLKLVALDGCIHELYFKHEGLDRIEEDIKLKCKNTNETQVTTS